LRRFELRSKARIGGSWGEVVVRGLQYTTVALHTNSSVRWGGSVEEPTSKILKQKRAHNLRRKEQGSKDTVFIPNPSNRQGGEIKKRPGPRRPMCAYPENIRGNRPRILTGDAKRRYGSF